MEHLRGAQAASELARAGTIEFIGLQMACLMTD